MTRILGVRRSEFALGCVTAVAILALWLVPPVGFVLAAILFALLPPWGRSITERAIISIVLIAGIVALTIPRSSEVPVTQTSARLGIAALLVVAFVLRSLPRLKKHAAIPKPQAIDFAIAALIAVIALWLMTAYRGVGPYGIVSGLFFTGWDNQGHFVPFANTYEVGKTTWPTLDGSIAWNQWYPSLHTTLWALVTQATHAVKLDRIQLLAPYVQNMAVSFALCMGTLAWIAQDLSKRLAKVLTPASALVTKAAPLVAIAAFALFALLGSPASLFNAGFTNFAMAVALTAATAYLSCRSMDDSRRIGWLLVPLGALAVIGLWTPLVLGIAPAGVVVLIALSKKTKWVGIAWAVATVLLIGGTTYLQTKAIVNVSGKDAGGFTQDLGAVNSGMVEFNLVAAFAAPIIVALLAAYLIKRRQFTIAVAAAGTVVAILPFLAITILGAVQANKGWLESYYVLKTLDAMLLFAAPAYAALVAIALIFFVALIAKSKIQVVGLSVAVSALVVAFVWVSSGTPGITAGQQRSESVKNSLVGEAIVNSAEAAKPYAASMPMMWDGAGNLPNLWLASLSGVMSKDQQTFYLSLPAFPYEAQAQQYVFDYLAGRPNVDLAMMWFRSISGQQLQELENQLPNQVTLVKVPMRSSLLCQECSL
jgi:hypothetical protein